MFYPKYNYSKGRIVAASSRPLRVASTARQRRAYSSSGSGGSGLNSAGGAAFQPYSPVYERAEDPTLAEEFLPTDRQTQNKIFRNIILYDPVAGPATEYWRELAFSQYVQIGNLEDNKIQQFYEDAVEAVGIVPQMKWLLDQYLVFGSFTLQMEMDEHLGYWVSCMVHDPDFVHVERPMFPQDNYIINVQPTNEHREWALSRDPRVVEDRKRYDPKFIKMMATGQTYPIPAQDGMFMPRKAHATDYYGTSYLTRIIPFKIMEKALLDAETMAARRRVGPVWVIGVPENYEAEEIQDIIDQFFAVEEDPVGGKVAVRGEVQITPLGGGKGDFWTLSDEYDFIKNAKLNALGISESFISGEANYNSMDKVVLIFLEKLRAMRTLFTQEVIINKIFKTLARLHDFTYKPQKQTAHHYRVARKTITDADLIIPEVEWDKPLEPKADMEYWDLLERLQGKGIHIHYRRWAQAAGYDLDESFDNAQQELEDRTKMYTLKAALAEQADKAGFDLEGNALGAGGEIGGGGFGGGGDFGGGLGGSEFGPDLEGGGMELGPSDLGGGPEAPPATPELPEPVAPTPPAGGEGAGAALEKARFPVKRPRRQRRHAQANDLPAMLRDLPLWDKQRQVFGLPFARVATLVDEISRRSYQEKDSRILTRYLRKQGLTTMQAETVQYCAARLGYMKTPQMSPTTIRHLQHYLTDRANQHGLDDKLNAEFSQLVKIANYRSKSSVGLMQNIKSIQDDLPDDKVLTGVR